MANLRENPFQKEFNDEQEEQQEEKESNVVDLKLIGGSNNPPDGNWLAGLELGTMFLARNKQNRNDYNLGLFRVVEKTEKSVVVRNPQIAYNLYLVPEVFCKAYDLHENLGVIEEKTIEDIEAFHKAMEEQQHQEP